MLSSNRFTSIQGKTTSWFSKCRVSFQNHFGTQKRLKKHCCTLRIIAWYNKGGIIDIGLFADPCTPTKKQRC